MEITVREAQLQDVGAVLQVYADAGIAGKGLTIRRAGEIFERMSRYPNYKLFVAEVEGRVCGTFALLIMDNLAHGGSSSGVVEDVAVVRSHRRMGIGRAMMSFALERCADLGCYKMALSSNRKRTDAHGFYESLGFTRHGYSYLVDLL